MSEILDFEGFPKIARLSRPCVITEKIDGTNGCVFIRPPDAYYPDEGFEPGVDAQVEIDGEHAFVRAGSRTCWISPTDDSFGFARWVHENAAELSRLGPGRHYGEWFGSGIQRGYGLPKGERRFSLFNTSRWGDDVVRPACCGVVPALYQGPFTTRHVDDALDHLFVHGSVVSPGFMQPEGVVVFHEASGHLYKKTCEHDEEPKLAHPKKERAPQEHKPKDKSVGGRRAMVQPVYVGAERRRT